MSAKRFVQTHFELIVAALAFGLAAGYSVLLHRFFMAQPGAIGFDEGYIAAAGERLIEGRWLPYVDNASHRGPLLYWVTALFEWVGGRSSWIPIRWLCLLGHLATIGGLFGIGVAARMPLAGAVAALLDSYFVLFVLHPTNGAALNGETIAAPLAVLALFATTMALLRAGSERARYGWLFGAGVAASLAMFAKQTSAFVVGPLLLWTALASWPSPGTGRRRVGAVVAGFLFPAAVVLTRYALAGELGAFSYWFYGYNADIYMQPYTEGAVNRNVTDWVTGEAFAVLAVLLVLVWSLARTVASLAKLGEGAASAYATDGLEATAALLGAVTLISVLAPLRFWGHYFLVLAPWVTLVIGIRGELALRSEHRRTQLTRTFAALVGLAWFVGWALNARHNGLGNERARGLWGPGVPDDICFAVSEHSERGDALFVWGFDGDLYISCQRRPASRFTYTTMVAGVVPPFWTHAKPERVARGARETLLEELRREMPPVVLDAPARIGGFSMRRIGELDSFLRERYCYRRTVKGNGDRYVQLWSLKGEEKCRSAPPMAARHSLQNRAPSPEAGPILHRPRAIPPSLNRSAGEQRE